MQNRVCKRWIKSIILVLTCMTVLLGNPVILRADKASELEQSISEKKTQIKQAENEKKQIKGNLTDIEKVKKELQNSRANLNEYVSNLDANVSQIQEKIDELKATIEKKEKDIVQKEKELDEAITVKEQQYERMKLRIQAMYEQGDTYYMSMLTESHGMGDMLNRMEYINEIAAYDNRMLEEYKKNVEYVSLCKEELEQEKEVLDESKAAAESEQAALEDLIDVKKKEIEGVNADIAQKDKLIKEYEAQIAQQDAEIAELEKLVAAEQAQLAKQRNYDGGMFTWPAPSYTRISDDYGYRIHPTLGVKQFHSGVDMASPGGSNILAAYDGTVVSASYSSSMGNYVMINHGDGLYTVYMHASKLCVSSGQDVSKGQVIALVGSTGRSTGNHLHFGVRLNGSYVSPWGYLSKP